MAPTGFSLFPCVLHRPSPPPWHFPPHPLFLSGRGPSRGDRKRRCDLCTVVDFSTFFFETGKLKMLRKCHLILPFVPLFFFSSSSSSFFFVSQFPCRRFLLQIDENIFCALRFSSFSERCGDAKILKWWRVGFVDRQKKKDDSSKVKGNRK